MKPVPWHVEGVHPNARDAARDAARRRGLSVGQWLNSLIAEGATDTDLAAPPRPAVGTAPPGDLGPGGSEDRRVGTLVRQVEALQSKVDRLGSRSGAESGLSAEAAPSARLAKSIVRNDRRLDVLGEHDPHHASQSSEVDEALAEITARQQALDREAIVSGPPDSQSGEGARSGAVAIEQQLSDIAAQIKALRESSRSSAWRVSSPARWRMGRRR